MKLEQITGAHIQRVDGHLFAYEILGALEVERIGGHLTVHSMAGALTAEARGSAKIQALSGAITLHTGGKAQVELLPQPDAAPDGASSIRAGGKIELSLDPTADATVTIQGPRGVRTHVFGKGTIPIALEAGAGVALGETLAPILRTAKAAFV